MGQVELFVGKGDGRLKAHPVCPDEGSCLQKVICRCRFGHRLIGKFAGSCVEVETSNVDRREPDALHPRSVRFFCFDYGEVEFLQSCSSIA